MMTWRIVHVKESEFMKLKLDNLEISKRGQKYYVPLSDISILDISILIVEATPL
jgi:CRISPR-associated protein Cas1